MKTQDGKKEDWLPMRARVKKVVIGEVGFLFFPLVPGLIGIET
jgi:hypothetical protein